jgi:hypothetical protein
MYPAQLHVWQQSILRYVRFVFPCLMGNIWCPLNLENAETSHVICCALLGNILSFSTIVVFTKPRNKMSPNPGYTVSILLHFPKSSHSSYPSPVSSSSALPSPSTSPSNFRPPLSNPHTRLPATTSSPSLRSTSLATHTNDTIQVHTSAAWP